MAPDFEVETEFDAAGIIGFRAHGVDLKPWIFAAIAFITGVCLILLGRTRSPRVRRMCTALGSALATIALLALIALAWPRASSFSTIEENHESEGNIGWSTFTPFRLLAIRKVMEITRGGPV